MLKKSKIVLNSLQELEPVKQFITNAHPQVIKRKPTKIFIFAYLITENKCKSKLLDSTSKVINVPDGYTKYPIQALSEGSAVSQFETQIRKEAGIKKFTYSFD